MKNPFENPIKYQFKNPCKNPFKNPCKNPFKNQSKNIELKIFKTLKNPDFLCSKRGSENSLFFKANSKNIIQLLVFPKKDVFNRPNFWLHFFFKNWKYDKMACFRRGSAFQKMKTCDKTKKLSMQGWTMFFSSCNPHAPFNVSRLSTRHNSAFYTSVRQKIIIWHWMGHVGAQVLIKKSLKMAYRGTAPFLK